MSTLMTLSRPARQEVPRLETFTVQQGAGGDIENCIATLLLAFAPDPAVRWLYPSASQYREHFPELVRALGGAAFQKGTAHHLDESLGWALWLPPEANPDENALAAVIESSVPPDRLEEANAFFDLMGRHHPEEEHWYLPLMGIDPLWHGKRQGSRLLRHALEIIDREQGTAYLEATTMRSVPLYQRHGFEVIGKIQVGRSPAIYPMLRRPFATWM